jgi:hypothetical protein
LRKINLSVNLKSVGEVRICLQAYFSESNIYANLAGVNIHDIFRTKEMQVTSHRIVPDGVALML